jgi:hypothetical protein
MVKSKPSKISRLPTRTSLIADSTMFGIGMAAAGKKMHNHFLFYAFPRSKYAKIRAQKSGYAEFVLTVPRTMGLDHAQNRVTTIYNVLQVKERQDYFAKERCRRGRDPCA